MRVLVAYASKRGSTAEIADAVAERLRAAGHEVDCAEIGGVDGLGGYGAAVLGSAVYVKRWRGDARRFLRQHGDELASMPFWIFSSGPVGEAGDDEEDWAEPAKTVARAEGLGVRGHVVFGGAMPAEPQGFVEKAMVRNTPEELRDRRDWEEIAAWADGVARELSNVGA